MYGTKEYAELFKVIHKETGVHHPEFLKKPALRSDCIQYLNAFRSLSASRMWSQAGASPIQISEIAALLDFLGEDDFEEREVYMDFIQELDRIELKHLYESSKRATK